MTTEAQEFEAAFKGEEIPEEAKEELEETEEVSEEQEAPEEENLTEEEPSLVEKEIAGLSPEALASLEQKLTATIEQKLSGRLRNLEGNLGGIKQKLDMMATAKAAAEESGSDAPTAKQINEAVKDGEKMKALREDFPDFADALDERLQNIQGSNTEELQKQLKAAEAKATSTAEELQNLRNEIATSRELDKLERVHPDWETHRHSDQFQNWFYNQPPEMQQKAGSMKANDAIALMNAYKASLPKTSKPNNNRLEDAITPTQGNARSGPSRKTEHEEFEAAYKAARYGE